MMGFFKGFFDYDVELKIAGIVFVGLLVVAGILCNGISKTLVQSEKDRCVTMMRYARTAHDSMEAQLHCDNVRMVQ